MVETIKNQGNPLLPLGINMCDCEAHVLGDGKLHIVGSVDVYENEYCSKHYHHIYTEDMVNWVIEKNIFSWEEKEQLKLYAPDFCEISGYIYLFFCLSDGREGYLCAEKWSKFKNAEINFFSVKGIDPSVLVDNEEVYYYWGQFSLHAAKLIEVKSKLNLISCKKDILTEQLHYFHEGVSIRKIKGKYYALYASIKNGKPTALDYAIAAKPFGPYKRMGTVVDNNTCDPKVWNNHGSIESFKGQWYVFYHRSYNNSPYMRHLCIEKIDIDETGKIQYVNMTSSGIADSVMKESYFAYECAEIVGKGFLKKTGITEVIKGYRDDELNFRYCTIPNVINRIMVVCTGFAILEWYINEEFMAKTVSINGKTCILKKNNEVRSGRGVTLKIIIKKCVAFRMNSFLLE